MFADVGPKIESYPETFGREYKLETCYISTRPCYREINSKFEINNIYYKFTTDRSGFARVQC
jgi:hypothetical protein